MKKKEFEEIKTLLLELKNESNLHLRDSIYKKILSYIKDIENHYNEWEAFERDLMS